MCVPGHHRHQLIAVAGGRACCCILKTHPTDREHTYLLEADHVCVEQHAVVEDLALYVLVHLQEHTQANTEGGGKKR